MFREEFRAALESKTTQITNLKSEVSHLKDRIVKLEERIDDGDAYERRDTLIFTGDGVPVGLSDENPVSVVCGLVREKLKIAIQPSDISTAHRMGRKPVTQAPDTRKLVVKFCRRDIKKDILLAGKNLKPNFYVNESLTPIRNTILFALRKMRRAHPNIVKGACTIDGRVFAWVSPSPESQSNVRILVNSHSSLLKLS